MTGTDERDPYIEEAQRTRHERAKYGSQMRSICFTRVFKRTLSQHLKIGEIRVFKNSKLLWFLELEKS